MDQLLDVNNESYQVHKQGKFRLGTSSNSTAFPVANTYHESGKVSIDKTLYFNRYLPKKLKYDDTYIGPTNCNLWLIIFPTFVNGGSNTAYIPATIGYAITHTYEDA